MDLKGSRLYLLAVIFLFVLTGCSHSHNPVTVDQSNDADAIATDGSPVAQTPSMPSENGNRILWGYWDVRISPDDLTIEAVPDRASAMHFNVVRLIEVTPCPYCLKIENIQWQPGNIVEADFRLQHPFPGLDKFTGFDVRGIFISEADFLFPEMDRRMAYGMDVPKLLDPDGFTSLFNPTEFPEGTAPFPMLGYITGKYSTGGPLSTTLNPYVAYGTENPRRLFEAGTAEARRVRIHYPSLPVEFGYAVDASWFPAGDVIDPVTDFPPEANCMEAYKIQVQGGEPVVVSSGDSIEFCIEVFDHQGLDTISTVRVEAPGIFSGVMNPPFAGQSGPDSWLYNIHIYSGISLLGGTYPILVRVEDVMDDGNLGRVNAWGVVEVTVEDKGWAWEWGGPDADYSNFVAVDDMGNAYVVGHFVWRADFDPDGGDLHIAKGNSDCFLTKYDAAGNFQWARTWGGEASEDCEGVTVDSAGGVYVTGDFEGIIDFNPSGGDIRESRGYWDAYLSKFDSEGNFQWVRTWGSSIGSVCPIAVSMDTLGNLFVTGWFQEIAYFNPDGGDVRISNGRGDGFVSLFDASGNFYWVQSWGGTTGNEHPLAIDTDNAGNVYITGRYGGDTDVNPDGGDPHPCRGTTDIFLSKFDSTGAFHWGRTWGGTSQDWGYGVGCDSTLGVCVGGLFGSTVDFDPAGGDVRSSAGHMDVFVTRFDSSGNHEWARTWGGPEGDEGAGVSVDVYGNVHVTGFFHGTIDFDPDGGDLHTSNGEGDAFLSIFDRYGNFVWARTWGGPRWDRSHKSAVDPGGSTFVTGWTSDTANFAPSTYPCYSDPVYRTSNGDLDVYLTKYPISGCW
jgi:hypothetical protein